MSEIGLNINVDSYNNEGIKTIKGNNNAEIYKLYILKNKRRLSLVGKTVKLGYVMAGTTNGDVIENLNITNAEQGEITFPITNRISKQDGVYSCQLAIYGADGFLEHTATFGLTVEANIFTKIAGEIADSKDFTYLENILDKASKLSEKLKENTSSATNANSNLESNITEANNINSKLLENTSTATSLNKNLESNIDLAKEVKETIKDLDTKNIEATEKIETLTGLNAKATELSNNINQALPLNSELIKNVESAKVANTNLAATNQEAVSKNTELQASLEKTKEFIDGLDGSQNIPGIRMELTELQNGLKSNQALEYSGDFITANNTLEGRSEGMIIKGRTLVNLVSNNPAKNAGNVQIEKLLKSEMFKVGTTYTVNIPNRNNKQIIIVVKTKDGVTKNINLSSTTNTFTVEEDYPIVFRLTLHTTNGWDVNNDLTNADKSVIVEGNNIIIDNYFEGLKSFGEQEGNKISILSRNKNLFNLSKFEDNTIYYQDTGIKGNLNQYKAMRIKTTPNKSYFFTNPNVGTTVQCVAYKNGVRVSGGYNWRGLLTKDCDEYVFSFLKTEILSNDFQFEEGTQATSYEPYKQDKKDILIKEPLRSVGDIQDIMYEDNGQVKIDRYIYTYTFNGEEKWDYIPAQSQGNTAYFQTNLLDGKVKYPSPRLICNTLKAKVNLWNVDDIEGINVEGNIQGVFCLRIRILKSKLSTTNVDGLKAWLKANPTTIVYQLATPVTEIVENCVDIDLDTYQEKTYFNILNSLPGSLDFKVPSNIASIVQNTAREVNNIWDVINNLLVPSLIDINKNVAMSTIKNNLK
ncbi:BppU family phage baseplate upper protein [Clostridium perfringens]|uniref:BppU family phage baseplate upper protein n=1 Tax=Clostridium perfringens TaxID=1502 RepID=UPI0024BC61B1|nr:BppU family phage baseplate upper protein [Clostridium perfringens]